MMNDKDAIKDIYKRYEKAKNAQNIEDTYLAKKSNPALKYAALLLGAVILSTSISIGNNFFNYRSKSNVGYLDKNLYTDIADNKLQNVNMNYCYSNDVGVKVSNILIDNNKMYIVFDFKFDEALEENVNLLKLPDLMITNENNDVLFCKDYEQYIQYCKDNNLNYLENNTETNFNFTTQFIEKDNNNIKYLLIFSKNEDFKNNNKLFLKFNTISLSNNLSIEENDTLNGLFKEGKWNLELNLKEQ